MLHCFFSIQTQKRSRWFEMSLQAEHRTDNSPLPCHQIAVSNNHQCLDSVSKLFRKVSSRWLLLLAEKCVLKTLSWTSPWLATNTPSQAAVCFASCF